MAVMWGAFPSLRLLLTAGFSMAPTLAEQSKNPLQSELTVGQNKSALKTSVTKGSQGRAADQESSLASCSGALMPITNLFLVIK